ncbi:calcium-binding protein [Pseudoalteromonas sp. McH1-42]|uniref:calcium-binding protein n=1 Tax=Pseudoalteromonas sp. McH1-42 TaxID=2917752 RepID=UPI001EF69B15|nr:calcium-binding protein [Pseudoalteromonas sp. McH1-42]MCG7564225.1 calcium-binding protein [Pseudoalteromonas sp. McH1-42]
MVVYQKALLAAALSLTLLPNNALATRLAAPGAYCNGLDRTQIDIGEHVENQYMVYLALSPKLADTALTVRGTQNSIVVSYGGRCEVLNGSSYNGLHVNLPDSGEYYNGANLDFHQQVYGGEGNDTILTGNKVDYVYGNGGNDQIYTFRDYERVDGGAGADCVEEGDEGTIQSRFENVESTSCANYAPASCEGLDRAKIAVADDNSLNPYMNYLSVSPSVSGEKLTAEGDDALVTVYYAGSCETFDVSNHNGFQVNLADSGEEYDGTALNWHQLVYGGDGNDTILTGNKVDYVYAGKGDDIIYTYGDYEKVDGGTGMDCLTEGSTGSIQSNISGIEQYTCTPVGDVPASLTTAYERCHIQTGSFDSELSNGVWKLRALDSNLTLFVEEHDEYVFAYSAGYQHCAFSNAVEEVEVQLSNGNDVLAASGVGRDMTVYGLNGNDTIQTGRGNDLIFGGDGKDKIRAGDGNDWVAGGSEIETDHDGVVHRVRISGYNNDGADDIKGENGNDVLFGNRDGDDISGGDGEDIIFGNDGNRDRLSGNSGADIIVDSGGGSWGNRAKSWGGSGQDILVCERGHCELSGGGSKDFLAAISTHSDIGLYGGGGGDILFVRGDEIPSGTGGSGNDLIYNEWNDRDISGYVSSAKHRSGYFDRAVRKAGSGMSSRHEEVLRLKQFYNEKGYSEFKGRIADLVDEDTFEAWLNNRSKSVYDLQ